jgi:pimeloyl-ACP methyl ester carboxylesterase
MTVRTVMSKDGTRIAFDRIGEGPPVIFVGGALNDRTFPPLVELAELVAPRFTAYNYDRRGRGDSGDTSPYAVAREVEDLEALIAEAGGRASVYGLSSGAVLALEAAARGAPIDSLALFEPPLDVEGEETSEEETAQLAELVAAGRRGEAVEAFLSGVLPAEVIAEMKRSPMWSAYEAMAPTLVYEGLITR